MLAQIKIALSLLQRQYQRQKIVYEVDFPGLAGGKNNRPLAAGTWPSPSPRCLGYTFISFLPLVGGNDIEIFLCEINRVVHYLLELPGYVRRPGPGGGVRPSPEPSPWGCPSGIPWYFPDRTGIYSAAAPPLSGKIRRPVPSYRIHWPSSSE